MHAHMEMLLFSTFLLLMEFFHSKAHGRRRLSPRTQRLNIALCTDYTYILRRRAVAALLGRLRES
jgi:hypothetical protein